MFNVDSFSDDFITDKEYFYFRDNYDYGNIEDLYNEIKKYMLMNFEIYLTNKK